MLEQRDQFLNASLYTAGAIVTAATAVVLYQSSFFFLSALIGVGVACLLSPMITRIEKRWKIPRFAGALTLLILIGLAVLGLFLLAGAILFEQLESFSQDLPQIMEKWSLRWEGFVEDYPKLNSVFAGGESIGLAKNVFSNLGGFLSGGLSAATGLTLAAVIALFCSVNAKRYYEGTLSLVSKDHRKKFEGFCERSAEVLRKWFFAQFLDMCIIGLLTTFGLWAAGVQYWALYGLMTGVLSIMPYVGILVVVCFSASVVAVLQPEKIIPLGVVFFLTQQLEGNFILPKLMKEHVQVPAALLIFLMLLAGTWLGVLGIFVTPPLLAIGICQFRFSRSGDVKKMKPA